MQAVEGAWEGVDRRKKTTEGPSMPAETAGTSAMLPSSNEGLERLVDDLEEVGSQNTLSLALAMKGEVKVAT